MMVMPDAGNCRQRINFSPVISPEGRFLRQDKL